MHYFLLESGMSPRPKYFPLDSFHKNSSLLLDQPVLSEAYCLPERQSPWFLPLCLPKVNSLGRVEGFPFLLGKDSIISGACGSILHLGKVTICSRWGGQEQGLQLLWTLAEQNCTRVALR